MNAAYAIARRELAALLASPIGWICLVFFCFLGGGYFTMILGAYYDQYSSAMFNPEAADQMSVNDWVIQPFFSFLYIVMILLAPVLTMRLLAEDRRQRVMELLLTSPIGSASIATGKLLGALGFAGVLALATLPPMWVLYTLGDPDSGIVLANYVAFLLLSGALMSAGLWFSSLTENQIVAAVLSFFFGLSLWIFGFLPTLLPEGALKSFAEGLSLLPHAENLGKGVLRLSDLAYFGTFTGFFLFATTQRVEALRWR